MSLLSSQLVKIRQKRARILWEPHTEIPKLSAIDEKCDGETDGPKTDSTHLLEDAFSYVERRHVENVHTKTIALH